MGAPKSTELQISNFAAAAAAAAGKQQECMQQERIQQARMQQAGSRPNRERIPEREPRREIPKILCIVLTLRGSDQFGFQSLNISVSNQYIFYVEFCIPFDNTAPPPQSPNRKHAFLILPFTVCSRSGCLKSTWNGRFHFSNTRGLWIFELTTYVSVWNTTGFQACSFDTTYCFCLYTKRSINQFVCAHNIRTPQYVRF